MAAIRAGAVPGFLRHPGWPTGLGPLVSASARRFRRLGLLGRFTVVGALVGLVVASGLAWLIEARMTAFMQEQIAARAVNQVHLGLQDHVSADDFEPPYTPEKLEGLRQRLDPHLGPIVAEGSGTIRLHLFGRDGTIVYSDVPEKRGYVASFAQSPLLANALDGSVGSKISTLSSPKTAELKERYGSALEVYVPFVLGGRVVGVYEIYQDLAPVHPVRPLVWGAVLGGFLVLFLALLAVVRGAAALIRRQQAEREHLFRQMAQADKLRGLGQMASGIAHDLNQSLALVAGYSELARRALEQTPPDLAALHEALPVVGQAAADGGTTVKRLLAFARAPEEAPAEAVDLGQLLHEVARLTAPRWRDAAQAEGRPIDLRVAAEPGATVLGWPASLREALTNLVFNAVDALPTGGTVRLSVRRRGDAVEVEVADSGVGMPPEVQARVFEPFFSTKGERGTGLGLAQVYSATERHGGQVALSSAPGRGTTFRLAFPAAAAPVHAAAADAGAGAGAAGGARGLRVLAVDDEPRLGRMVALILGQDGHTVATATSAEAALERLAAEPFDLVISDVSMGLGMNGWELGAEVRRRWPGLRFVLATGWGAQIDPGEARAHGVAAVLAKPVRADDLRRVAAA